MPARTLTRNRSNGTQSVTRDGGPPSVAQKSAAPPDPRPPAATILPPPARPIPPPLPPGDGTVKVSSAIGEARIGIEVGPDGTGTLDGDPDGEPALPLDDDDLVAALMAADDNAEPDPVTAEFEVPEHGVVLLTVTNITPDPITARRAVGERTGTIDLAPGQKVTRRFKYNEGEFIILTVDGFDAFRWVALPDPF